jgi:hypothetical protein
MPFVWNSLMRSHAGCDDFFFSVLFFATATDEDVGFSATVGRSATFSFGALRFFVAVLDGMAATLRTGGFRLGVGVG